MGVKEPGFPGFFILGLSRRVAVCRLVQAQNRNVFLERHGSRLGISNDLECKMEAASGFEPLHRGKKRKDKK